MAEQTAVEWLFSQIPFEWSSSRAAHEALAIAKQMEKEQIMEAHNNGKNILPPNENGEQYYNETFTNNQ
jgi:hypothetical protein